jgi:hypothetical protein
MCISAERLFMDLKEAARVSSVERGHQKQGRQIMRSTMLSVAMAVAAASPVMAADFSTQYVDSPGYQREYRTYEREYRQPPPPVYVAPPRVEYAPPIVEYAPPIIVRRPVVVARPPVIVEEYPVYAAPQVYAYGYPRRGPWWGHRHFYRGGW